MYSPKIHEDLIPVLYHTARARNIPMTKLVDQLLVQSLSQQPQLPEKIREALAAFASPNPQPKP